MSFARLSPRLRFLPLGLLWGVVGGGFHTYLFVHVTDGPPPQFGPAVIRTLILMTIIMMLGACPIASLFGNALLKRDLTTRRWIVNWVITAFASSAAGVVIFWPMAFVMAVLMTAHQIPLFYNPSFSIAEGVVVVLLTLVFATTGLGVLVGIGSAAVALLMVPLSLLVRRLILRRRSVVEPAGGASQSHP